MNKFYILILFMGLSAPSFSQVEVEDNDLFGEATLITNTGTFTGVTDEDWQGDTWRLELDPGDYALDWIADACTRIRLVEYTSSWNPAIEEPDNTPGASSDCTFAIQYLGCFSVDNLSDLTANASQLFTVVEGRHYYMFLNPHNCTNQDYSVTISSATNLVDPQKGFENISVYPNPASDIFTITTEGQAEMKIIDITGKRIMNKKLIHKNTVVDVSQLLEGVYFIVINKGTRQKTLKLFKQPVKRGL